jgi:cyclopropane-fatty-acyl-phospholipid synthase
MAGEDITKTSVLGALRPGGQAAPTNPPSSSRDEWLIRQVLRHAGNPDVTVVLWDGREVRGSDRPPVGRIIIRDRRLLRHLASSPDVAFGDGYTNGGIEIEGDLTAVMRAIYDRMPIPAPPTFWSRLRGLLPEGNPLARAADNIYHHYDIGNDFYKLWLDEQMVYTCAYYAEPHFTLEEAQRAKMEHVCRKVWLRPGDSVVEAGCGWGALALHMARHHGVTVRAYNLSREQIAYARERARREGLADRVEFVQDDFRAITGQYDAFVSVGMLEHVHAKNYVQFGELIRRSLKPNGRGLVHSIGRNVPAPQSGWLMTRIFPGGYVPALREALTVMESQNLSVLDVENLRLHYARTLEHWLERFDAARGQVEAMFDAAFIRAWRLYLAGCIATFRAGVMQLFQIVFAPARNDDIPHNRAHLYRA